jgi:hypothetical protein
MIDCGPSVLYDAVALLPAAAATDDLLRESTAHDFVADAGSSSNSIRRLMLAFEPADVLLGVELKPDPLDQIKLGFEEIDVMLLVLHQAFEQIA